MNIFAKKSLGQNFLRDKNALLKIIDAGNIQKNDIVLEIGPGEGVLTEKILEKGACLYAVEKDSRLIPVLQEKFSTYSTKGLFTLIEGDILELPLSKIFKTTPSSFSIVANIPYYITGALIRLFLESDSQPTNMTLLVQKEVAERIIARNKKESLLSLSVKAYGTPKNFGIVKAGSFVPAPNVDSAILHIGNISKVFFNTHNITEDSFFKILKAGFAHKRKILSKNLKECGFKLPPSINEKVRAEDLCLEDWALITSYNS